MPNLWEEGVDICTWGSCLLTNLSIGRQLHSLLFYILEFGLEFGLAEVLTALNKQFGSICPIVCNSGP